MKERTQKYIEIIDRATKIGIVVYDRLSALMDIESADNKFNLRLDDWLEADKFNFTHDFIGIRENINRSAGFPAKDFGMFIPRFAGKREGECTNAE